MDIILLISAKPLDKRGTTLLHITYPPLISVLIFAMFSEVFTHVVGENVFKAYRETEQALFVQYFELGHFCLPVSPISQICMTKLASKHRTSDICLPTSKMCLLNVKCLKNLVVAKRARKDRLLKPSHVRQTMLVSFTRPLQFIAVKIPWQRFYKNNKK